MNHIKKALSDLGLRRYGLLGKKMSSSVWVEISYLDAIIKEPSRLPYLKDVQNSLPFKPRVFKYDVKSDIVSFIECDGFDSQDEPVIGRIATLKNGSLKISNPPSDPLIYHHKWMMVKDSYDGFCVSNSKKRSIYWKQKLGVNREISSRIGRLSFWTEWLQSILDKDEAWSPKEQEFTSKQTSINSKKVPRVFSTVASLGYFSQGDVNLDIGGGRYDTGSDYVNDLGVTNLIYDPYNRTAIHNERIINYVKERPVDSVTISNVLNVIKEDSVIRGIIKQAHVSLRDNGKLYVSIYEGNKTGIGKESGKDQWQRNETIDAYRVFISALFGQVIKKKNLLIATKC